MTNVRSLNAPTDDFAPERDPRSRIIGSGSPIREQSSSRASTGRVSAALIVAMVVGAVAFILYGPDGVDAKYTALPMQIFQWTSNPKRAFLDNAAAGILVLMTTLLVINGVAIWMRNRYQSRRS